MTYLLKNYTYLVFKQSTQKSPESLRAGRSLLGNQGNPRAGSNPSLRNRESHAQKGRVHRSESGNPARSNPSLRNRRSHAEWSTAEIAESHALGDPSPRITEIPCAGVAPSPGIAKFHAKESSIARESEGSHARSVPSLKNRRIPRAGDIFHLNLIIQ